MVKNQVPIVLVTGFLGSGKTTFLNWLIHTHPDLKISLILNEFGNIKLESQFVTEKTGGQVAELANGCMCCVAKSDIPRVINYILENSPQTQYIIIEASGLSDPDPIIEVLQQPQTKYKIRLDSILCIIDAVNFPKTRSQHPIVISQIGDADLVLISKTDQINPIALTELKSFIAGIGIGTKVLEFNKTLDPRLFLDPDINRQISSSAPASKSLQKPDHKHETMQEFMFKKDGQMNIDKITDIFSDLPFGIFRAKGIVNWQESKYLVQYVGSKLEIRKSNWESNDTKSNVILFLGTGFDEKKLNADLLSV